jgi:hypothetical protein
MASRVTVGGVAEDLLVPLPFADVVAILKDRGWTETMILEAMNQFGTGVNVYEEELRTKETPYGPTPVLQYIPVETRTK